MTLTGAVCADKRHKYIEGLYVWEENFKKKAWLMYGVDDVLHFFYPLFQMSTQNYKASHLFDRKDL